MTHHPIAVIGGGLGGLVAVRVLAVHGIAATVFELEADRSVRTQGGMLDIHEESGQRALEAAGLTPEFRALIHPGGQAMRVLDRTGTVRREEADAQDGDRPEVDRGQLRDLLLDSLPAGTIRWGSKVTAIRPVAGPAGRHEVELADGTSCTTDLLIGADGAWSRVRPLLSPAHPEYTGISFVEFDLFDADERHPAEAATMGGGMFFALGGDTAALGHRETDRSLHVYLGHRAGPEWIETLGPADGPAARAEVLALLADWAPSLRALVEHADTAFTPRRVHALPVGHSWPRVPGVTLLGDAAHVMSPFAGEGANLALLDGAELALAVAAHPQDREGALAAYEAELFPRSADAARESADNLEVMFAPDAPRGLLEMFSARDDLA